jgi:hydroxymethylpyrimidine/phosphomethylpyrimidine kinase
MLSAAVAAGLAHGLNLPESVKAAKQFVAGEIRSAAKLSSEIA